MGLIRIMHPEGLAAAMTEALERIPREPRPPRQPIDTVYACAHMTMSERPCIEGCHLASLPADEQRRGAITALWRAHGRALAARRETAAAEAWRAKWERRQRRRAARRRRREP